MINQDLKRRIIEISYKNKLSHIGSCLTAVDIIEEIYSLKKPDEKFILSSGHAGLALYCVIEKHEGVDAEKIFKHHGVHPDRCLDCHLYCSTGSLGQGLPIAVGMALANRSMQITQAWTKSRPKELVYQGVPYYVPNKNVYCLISDGECSEGSIWEAMRIKDEQKLDNLIVYLNFNGWGAYKETFGLEVPDWVKYKVTNSDQFPFLKGQDAHYYVMTEADYNNALLILETGVTTQQLADHIINMPKKSK